MIIAIIEAPLYESGCKSRDSLRLGEEGELLRGGNDLNFCNKEQEDLGHNVWSRRKKRVRKQKKQ